MREVNINRNEQRGLIMLRNELASYVVKNNVTKTIKKNIEIPTIDSKTFPAPNLPEPINHHSACSNCAYNLICYSFLSREKSTTLPDKHPLNAIQNQMPQLTPEHIDYFIKWNGLLALEEEQLNNGKVIFSLV